MKNDCPKYEVGDIFKWERTKDDILYGKITGEPKDYNHYWEFFLLGGKGEGYVLHKTKYVKCNFGKDSFWAKQTKNFGKSEIIEILYT